MTPRLRLLLPHSGSTWQTASSSSRVEMPARRGWICVAGAGMTERVDRWDRISKSRVFPGETTIWEYQAQKARAGSEEGRNAEAVHAARGRTNPGPRLRCEAFAICQASRGFAPWRMQVAPQQRRPLPFLRCQGCREILPTPPIQILGKLSDQEAGVIMPADGRTASTQTNERQHKKITLGRRGDATVK